MKSSNNKLIKSVIIRLKNRQNKLLIDKNCVPFFENFLKESIGTDVVVINTNIGLGVYYSSANDYSELIKRSVLIFNLKKGSTQRLYFDYNLDYDEVRMNFILGFRTFSKYPRLFLAYIKKFIHIRTKHQDSQIVMPILNDLYEHTLKKLYNENRLPFSEKIMGIDSAFFIKRKDPLLGNLARKIIAKEHFN